MRAPVDSAGVLTTACTKEEDSGNTGSGAAVKAANLGRWKSSLRQLPGFGRKAYPLQGEVTSPDRRGRKSHGRLASQDARVGATGVASKLVGLNISE